MKINLNCVEVLRKFTFLILFSLPSALFATETENNDGWDQSRYPVACDMYFDFLDTTLSLDSKDIEDCHELIQFIMVKDFEGISDHEYLTQILKYSGNSSFGLMAAALIIHKNENPVVTYSAHQVATIAIAVNMGKSHDDKRAALYTYINALLQNRAVQEMCDHCKPLPELNSIANILGINFSSLDDENPKNILMCLLRTDGFSTSMRDVVSSVKFQNCLQGQ